jgi:hypothetical protein
MYIIIIIINTVGSDGFRNASHKGDRCPRTTLLSVKAVLVAKCWTPLLCQKNSSKERPEE